MAKDVRNRPPDEKRVPRRYNLYNRLNLSVDTVNRVIYALIGVIVLLVLAGTLIR